MGNNLQDHPLIAHYYQVPDQTLLEANVGPTVSQLYDFYTSNSSLLSSLPNLVTFYSMPGNPDPEVPNGLTHSSIYTSLNNLTAFVEQFREDMRPAWRRYYGPYVGRQMLLIQTAAYRPFSRGTIRLRTSNVHDAPLINPAYFTDPRDLDQMVNLTSIIFYITQETPFARLSQPIPGPIPGCEAEYCYSGTPRYRCTAYLRCLATQIGNTGQHHSGSCRMGGVNRTDTVLDPRLRVKGISRLRVIDASVMPEVTNSNTMAPSMLIGERGVQMVIDDNRMA